MNLVSDSDTRTQAIGINEVKAPFLKVNKRVPQGSILGPLLF